jgi:transcriptional regulator with GAF, ATPase, and Fis domain
MTTLVKYPWPGNIRELQNVIERAAILTTGPILKVPSDGLRVPNNAPAPVVGVPGNRLAVPSGSNRNMRSELDDAERRQILAALEQANWTVAGPNGAAALLGMKRSTLQSRIQKLGIRISRTGA